jgi:RecA/RadA recombinase
MDVDGSHSVQQHYHQQQQQPQQQEQEEEDPEEAWRRWLLPDETAAALLQRTWVEPLHTGLPLIDRFMALRGGQVLEIASSAGAGRTTALLHVAACCVLPREAGGVAYGGKAGASRWARHASCTCFYISKSACARRTSSVSSSSTVSVQMPATLRFQLLYFCRRSVGHSSRVPCCSPCCPTRF